MRTHFKVPFVNALLQSLLFILFINNALAQTWQEKMFDPSVNIFEVKQDFDQFWSGRPIEKGKGYKQFMRWESFMEPRCFPTGERFSPDAVFVAMEQQPEMFSLNSMMNGDWSYIGNTSIPTGGGGVGRVNSVRNQPGSSTIYYACAPGGGLWKTTNTGVSWTLMNTDQLASIGISDIAIDPSDVNTLYIATGDGNAGDTYSLGVLKSTDGGLTWNPTGLSWNVQQNRTTSRIIIHPTNNQLLIVATNNGIWRTLDGGVNWTQEQTGSFKDLKFHPSNPSIVYATGTSFFRSTNAGDTWSNVTTGLPTTDVSRMALAVSPANSSYVYILAGAGNFGMKGLYRSTDAGLTWTQRSGTSPNILGWSVAGNDTGGQAWFDLALECDPNNAEIIYTGGVNIWKSTNGGTTFTLNGHWFGGGGAPYVHADIHALFWVPTTGRLMVGCDGGVFTTTNGGTTYTDISSNLQIAQQYRLGLSTSNSNLVITGWQDNGTNLKNGSTHTRPIGGDGMECIIHTSNNSIMYGELYYGEILKSTNGGASFNTTVCGSGGTGVNENGAWVTPYVLGNNPEHLYVGKTRVYFSNNGGTSFTALGAMGTGTINSLHVAPANNNIIYASKGGTLYKTINGSTFTTVSGLPGLFISYITTNPNDANEVFVTLSGFTSGQKVYKTTNGGTTWTNISGTLPNIPANCIVYQNGTNDGIYVGTDAGVFYRDENTGVWQPYMNALPKVVVTELEIHYLTGRIYASTYGRGLWSAPLFSLPQNDAAIVALNAPVGTYCNNTITPQVQVLNVGSDAITSLQFEYAVNGGAFQNFSWTGSILSSATVNINLPSISPPTGALDFEVNIITVNGVVDDNAANNSAASIAYITGGDNFLTFHLLTDCYPEETTWEIKQGSTTIYSGGNYNGSTLNDVPLCLPDGCYDLIVYDTYGDGLSSSLCPDGNYYITDDGTGATILSMTAANFQFQATQTFCLDSSLPGCTNPLACNFNPLAEVDNGSCTFGPVNDQCSGAIGITVNSPSLLISNASSCLNNTTPNCGGILQIQDLWYSFVYTGGNITIETSAGTISGVAPLTDTRIAVYSACGSSLIECDDDDGTGFYSKIDLLCANLTIGSTYLIQVGGYENSVGSFGLQVTSTAIPGCTNPIASNYNVCATTDNGTCIIPGCTNPVASNYNPAATVDNGTCVIPGCTNPVASNYNPAATVDNGTCVIPGCTNPVASNYNPAATVDNGTCIIPGCTNPVASNYNPAATVDNGTCIIPGCTNPVACNYNPSANQNNGSCILPSIYFIDNDGDGFGNPSISTTSCTPLIGYVVNSSDCNDSNFNIKPGAQETCGDNVDNDCDGLTDEGCNGVFAANDSYINATSVVVGNPNVCSTITGDLTLASPSSECESTCVTGEDLWYTFTAPTSGIRINVQSNACNILIEIQDASGNMIDWENLQGSIGNEILNFGNLTPGSSYFIAVRNYNSSQGNGTFNLCLSRMMESTCDLGYGPYSLCNQFKADWTGTSNYQFVFEPAEGGSPLTFTQWGSTRVLLGSVVGLAYNTEYIVSVNAIYSMSNGLGQMENVYVTGTSTCIIGIGSTPLMTLRNIDVCPAVKQAGQWIQAGPRVCGANQYEWEVQRADQSSVAVYAFSQNGSRFLQISGANGFISPGQYTVRVRPVVTSSIEIPFGPAQCVTVSGNAQGQTITDLSNSAVPDIQIFPNPASNQLFIWSNQFNEHLQVELYDMNGRIIDTRIFVRQESGSIELNGLDALSNGLYMVKITTDEKTFVQRLVVRH